VTFVTAGGRRDAVVPQGWRLGGRGASVCVRHTAEDAPIVRVELAADGPATAARVTWFDGEYRTFPF
jgi:hypothetical protein